MVVLSNSLKVTFPEVRGIPVSVSGAFEELAPYGEIMRLELLQDQAQVVVSYYDSRCAARVADELGSRCTWEPQYGQCTVRASGKVELPESTLGQICGACKDESSDLYSLIFYDVRAAETFAAEVGLIFDSAPKDKAFIAPARRLRAAPSAPRYLNDLGISQVVWADLDSGLETRTTLRINRLNSKLCNPKRFEMLLEEAGLAQYVDVFRTFTTARGDFGTALMNMTSTVGVKMVAKFFHGRQWGKTMPVSVSFAVTQGRDEELPISQEAKMHRSPRSGAAPVSQVLAKYPMQDCQLGVATRASKAEPLQVMFTSVENGSEASTEVSDEGESDGSSCGSTGGPVRLS
ncbi:unnamed protein product [Durusdinium trenchii]|uniref:Uncharacterized protein n=1 Tax=Durusdinium trenchii TaxID=1381693 RepID=A0ABP0IMK8_9DINO